MRTARLAGSSILLLGLVLLGGCGRKDGKVRLEGIGSSFVDPMMSEWKELYLAEHGVEINYQPKGSGAGISAMTSGDADFGCSDAPMNDEQLEKAEKEVGEVLHIPLVMGAIVPTYNLKGVDDLVFTGQVLMDVYRGKIRTWDHEDIKKLNPDRDLPGTKISVVYRSDSSGSTYILTDYFTKVNARAWKPGRGTAIDFPVGTGGKGNPGVAELVRQTEGAIGYVELIYALKSKLPYGSVINKAGKPIKATTRSVMAR